MACNLDLLKEEKNHSLCLLYSPLNIKILKNLHFLFAFIWKIDFTINATPMYVAFVPNCYTRPMCKNAEVFW